MDLQTDLAIQEIIHGEHFAGVTMLTIAHRLNTILNSDRILVLDCGAVSILLIVSCGVADQFGFSGGRIRLPQGFDG